MSYFIYSRNIFFKLTEFLIQKISEMLENFGISDIFGLFFYSRFGYKNSRRRLVSPLTRQFKGEKPPRCATVDFYPCLFYANLRIRLLQCVYKLFEVTTTFFKIAVESVACGRRGENHTFFRDFNSGCNGFFKVGNIE